MESESISVLRQIMNFIVEEWNILLVITFVVVMYFYHTSTFDHFEKKGVVFTKPKLFVGNIGKKLIGSQSISESTLEIYNKFKGNRLAGVFESRLPLLFVLDPDLIKAVTIKDFKNFVDRSKPVRFVKRPKVLDRMLLSLKGSTWKEVRCALTPTFSSARLKNMLPLMEHCSKQLVDYLQKFDGTVMEMKETMGRYTLEVIGVTAFGIKSDALYDKKSKFIELVDQLMTLPPISSKILVYITLILVPDMARLFNFPSIDFKVAKTLAEMVGKTMEQRRQSGQKKNDFLQLLMDAAEKEKNEAESSKEIQLNDDTIEGQSFLFLMAGYETSSSLLAFAIHMLTTKPDLQAKLRKHIEEVTEGKEISYELLSELTYLEGFLLEILRIYPPLTRIERVCTKNYVLPGTNVEVREGETIAIPVLGIHMDPDIYKDPTAFKPERFIGEARREIPSHLYLAFGRGPRNCIGSRFAMVSVKIAIVDLLKNFEFKICDKTEDPIKIHKRAALVTAENGIWVKLDKI